MMRKHRQVHVSIIEVLTGIREDIRGFHHEVEKLDGQLGPYAVKTKRNWQRVIDLRETVAEIARRVTALEQGTLPAEWQVHLDAAVEAAEEPDGPLQAAAEAWSGLRMSALYKKDRDREMGKARKAVVAYLEAYQESGDPDDDGWMLRRGAAGLLAGLELEDG